MAKKKQTTVNEVKPDKVDIKYASLEPTIKEDWTKKPPNQPFYDSSLVSYAIIIQSGTPIVGDIYVDQNNKKDQPELAVGKFGEKRERINSEEPKLVNQETFPEIIQQSKERFLKFYNKKVDEQNLEILKSSTIIRNIEVSPRPRYPNLFYVTVDAPTLDSIPEVKDYVLTPIPEERTINQLAEEYRDFFSTTDGTAKGRRERVSEILKANGIDVLTAEKIDVEEWIYRVNYGDVNPSGRDVKFNAGTEIYLPRTEPDFSRVVDGGQEIELEIGNIRDNISKLTGMLDEYNKKIKDSQFVVKNFQASRQVKELKNFLPNLRKHFTNNQYDFRNFLADNVRIGLDKDFKLVYIGLSSGGNVVYLNKAVPSLAKESPFNSKRTMNFISNLQELSLLNQAVLPWAEFVSRYVTPRAEIASKDPESVFADLQQSTNTILEQLSSRFDKFSSKSNRQLGEENSIYGSVQILNGIYQQQASKVESTGDAIFQNLADISAKIANPKDTAIGATSIVYNEVLNKIDFKSLVASAVDCLREQVPFDCQDILSAIAEENLDLVATTFRARTNPNAHEAIDQALQIAITSDFTLYDGVYSSLSEGLSGESEARIFFGTLEVGLAARGVDYDSIFQEVCSILSDPKQLVPATFSIPTMFLPDDLVTVDIDGNLVKSIEEAILQMIASLVVSMVQAVIDTILDSCRESIDGEASAAGSASPDYGSGVDLSDAIASKIGTPNLASAIEDLFDSLGTAPPPAAALPSAPDVVELVSGSIDAGSEFVATGVETQQTVVDIQGKVSLMKKLFSTLKQELTSPEIIRLLEGNASSYLLGVVLDIVDTNEELVGLRSIIETKEDVEDMFVKISSLADVGPTIQQVNILSTQLGCSLDDFVSSRVPLWCTKVTKDQITDLSEQTLFDEKKKLTDYYKELVKKPDVLVPDITCQDEESPVKGMVPKDTNSFSYLLEQVLKTIFDGVYMAYDDTVLTLPDPLFVPVKTERKVNRTTTVGQELSIDYYNFSKLQEETITLEFPDEKATGGLFEGIDLPDKRVINPEFQRLISNGLVPPDGDPNGAFGPYTTKYSRADGLFKNLELVPTPLPAITVNESVPTFAANSRLALENINKTQFTSSNGTISYALTEPFNESNFKVSQYVVKMDLLEDNGFEFRVGQIPVDPNTLVPREQDGVVIPGFSISPFNSAIYQLSYSGQIIAPAGAQDMRSYVTSETDFIGGEAPQMASLARYLEIILRNGLRANLSGEQKEDIKNFVKQSMFSDVMKQMLNGVAYDILQSPMFKFTKDNKVPYMSLVDWAPLPTEDEAECGYDPHILSLDTFRRRIREDYENKIECSPINKEISPDGLGRADLTSLEAATMSGCVMTTLRAYALEQLLREVFPVSAFSGRELLSQVHIKYIVEKIRDEMYSKSSAYFEAFLGQLEKTFSDRMEEFSPYGEIPKVIEEAEKVGVKWVYAQAALDEFNGVSSEQVTVEPITGVGVELSPPASISPDVPNLANSDLFEGDSGIAQPFATLTSPPATTTPGQQVSEDIEVVSTPDEDTVTDSPVSSLCGDGNSAVVIPTTSLYNILKNRFSFLVEEQLYSVLEKLQDLTSLKGTNSFYDRFVSKGMPIFDIQKNPGDARFSEVASRDLVTLEQEEIDRQYAVYSSKYNEWVTAKQNWALLANVAPPAIMPIAQLIGAAIMAAPAVPVPRIVPEGEDDLFYTRANGVEYKYLNVNIPDVFSQVFENLDLTSPPDWILFGTEDDPSVTPTGIDVGAFFDSVLPEGSNVSPFPRIKDFVTGLERGKATELKSVQPTRGEEEVPFNLSVDQGQVILERYVKTTTPPLSVLSGIDSFQGQRYSDTISQPARNDPRASAGSSFQQLNSTSGIPVTEILSPRETVNTSLRSCDPGVPSGGTTIDRLLEDTEPSESLGGEINTVREKIWNLDDFEQHIRDLAEQDPNSTLSSKYEKISFGMRMVYVAPLNDFLVTGADDPTKIADQRKLLNREFIFNEAVVESSKSFLQYETLKVKEKVSDFSAQDDVDNQFLPAAKPKAESESSGIEEREEKRVLRLFPLHSAEFSDRQLSPDTKMSQVLAKLGIDDGDFDNAKQLYRDKYMSILQNDLKNSSAFDYLFRFSVPGDFLLSFVSIYSNLVNELDSTYFDKVKFELKSLFEVVENGGDYTFQTDEQKKSGGNRGAYAFAKANYGTEGKARNPGLFDLAVKTPKAIFKGLTEFVDPVISISSKIVKAGNAGKLLPQVMKVLNPDGTPGGANDENYFLSDIVLPKGSVPPPVGDVLGKKPTVIQSTVLPSDSTKDYPANNEIVTFRLRDQITKVSGDEGNSLFDKYLQKVFFEIYKPSKNETFDRYVLPDHDGAPENLNSSATDKNRMFQRFALALVNRDIQTMSTTLLSSYMEDMDVVRQGVIKELSGAYPNIETYLSSFSPFVFKNLRESEDPFLCDAGEKVLQILKGQQPVNPDNFIPEGANYSLATGFLQTVNEDGQVVNTEDRVLDWIIWGVVDGVFTLPFPPVPEPIFPGYPIPLPITPVAMSLLPNDVVPYGPGPPHTPLGHIYHAIVAAESLSNISLDQKSIQREREGIENKKKLRGKLCIDMEQIAAEERKRRGME